MKEKQNKKANISQETKTRKIPATLSQKSKPHTRREPKVMRIKSYVKSPMHIECNVIPRTKCEMKYLKNLMKNGKESDIPPTNQPVMTMKSHPMEIKSHVIPAETMKRLMGDLKNNLNKNVRKTPIRNSVLEFIRKVELMKERENKSSNSLSNVTKNELTPNKPLKDNVVEFMKKVELMKEKKKKQRKPIMSVMSRVIQETKQDREGNIKMNIHSHIIPLQHFDFDFGKRISPSG